MSCYIMSYYVLLNFLYINFVFFDAFSLILYLILLKDPFLKCICLKRYYLILFNTLYYIFLSIYLDSVIKIPLFSLQRK